MNAQVDRERQNEGYSYRSEVPSTGGGHSLLDYLASTFSHSSYLQWQQRIEAGQLEVEGRLQTDPLIPVRAGAKICWHRPPWLEPAAPQEYQVLYADEQILAIDKPSGLPTLPGGGFLLNTLLSQVRETYPAAVPVHRLGRATSGIVLFALNEAVASQLSQAWPQVTKVYRALAEGHAREDCFDIRTKIGPIDHPRLGTIHAASDSGRSAHSIAQAVERGTDSTLFDVEILTGRPHQIRIHLASIGHPLVGDPIYAAGGGLQSSPGLPGDPGYFLHAMTMKLAHPVTGQELVLHCPPNLALKGSGVNSAKHPKGRSGY